MMRTSPWILSLALVTGCPATDASTDDTDTDADTDTCEGEVDDCGVCEGGNADKDCAGVCFGDAEEDACGTCDDDPGNDCRAALIDGGTWSCSTGESCGDVYALDLTEGTTLDVGVFGVTGSSVPRLALYGPDDDRTDPNRFTGDLLGHACGGQDDDETVDGFVADQDGTWELMVTRDWGSSAGGDGTYRVAILADPGVVSTGLLEDDVVSAHDDTVCGYLWSTDETWSCGSGDTCRDVYELDLPAQTELTLHVFDVTGASVTTLALYEPGEPLSGTNALTGDDDAWSCEDQDDSLTERFTTTTEGTWHLTVGRDWGTSAGSSGSYRLEVLMDGDGAFSEATLTDDDVLTEAAGISCPVL